MYSKIIIAEDIENINDIKNKMVLFILLFSSFFFSVYFNYTTSNNPSVQTYYFHICIYIYIYQMKKYIFIICYLFMF